MSKGKLDKLILDSADYSVCNQVSIYYSCEDDSDFSLEDEMSKMQDYSFKHMFIHFYILESGNDDNIGLIMSKPIDKNMICMKTGKTFAQLYEEYTGIELKA